MDTLTIHVCAADDARRLAPLVAALASEEGAEPIEQSAMVAVIRDLIETTASDFLLATLDGQEVGCLQISWRVSTWHAAPYAYLEDVYVIPQARSRGVGRRMLAAATARAQARGADQMMLDVRRDNRMAQRLYERIGFDSSGSILMKRALDGH